MDSALEVLKNTVSRWWGEIFTLTILNVAWLACQLVIIPGPPATATFYITVLRLAEGEYLSSHVIWSDFKDVFWRAWQWGLVNFIIIGIAIGNFYAYRDLSGLGWSLLKLLWGTVLLGWLLVQFFYWPFFYQQEERSFRLTLSNAAKLLLANPGFGLFIGLFSLALACISVLLGIPLGVSLMPWLALIGTYALRDRLSRYKEKL